MSATVPNSLIAAFRQVVGESNVITDPSITAGYATDWTGRWRGSAACVIRPVSETQVGPVLQLCHDAHVGVVPQGGNTGLVGGSVPHHNEVVLSLTGLNTLGPVDRDTMQVTAGAGVTLAALHQHAAANGVAYGVDMASRESATIGGSVATDAGGIRVVRYGTTRRQVTGMAVALPTGVEVKRLDGLAKDTVGYALPQLFIGAEGTLGVLTRLQLRVVPRYDKRAVAVVAVDGLADAVAFARHVRAELDTIDALEVMLASGVELVTSHTATAMPFPMRYPAYVLVESAARHDPFGPLAEVLSGATMVRDAVVAEDRPTRQRLWALREGHTEAINATATRLEKFDVAVPLPKLETVVTELTGALRRLHPNAKLHVFGHLAEGNLHLNLCDLPANDSTVSELIVETVVAAGGSIAAEHGLGVQKTPYMDRVRSADEQALYRAVKTVCDPHGILNPGVIVT